MLAAAILSRVAARSKGAGWDAVGCCAGSEAPAEAGNGTGWSHTVLRLPGRARLISVSAAAPSQRAHGFNVFITCLTRCLIASPLNGAVTVETRNKRPPENEMIKQVTLAKQTRCSHSPGCACSVCPGKRGAGWERAGTHTWKHGNTRRCLLGEERCLPQRDDAVCLQERHVENSEVCSGKMEDSEDRTQPCNWGKNSN